MQDLSGGCEQAVALPVEDQGAPVRIQLLAPKDQAVLILLLLTLLVYGKPFTQWAFTLFADSFGWNKTPAFTTELTPLTVTSRANCPSRSGNRSYLAVRKKQVTV